jgi:hypothetical protein
LFGVCQQLVRFISSPEWSAVAVNRANYSSWLGD